MHEDVVEETGDLRVRIEDDDNPSEPYDDGSTPLLRFDHHRSYDTWQVEQVKRTSFEVPGTILAAARKWGPDEVFLRYLRIFHGMSSHDDYATSDYDYLTFDTAAWREAMGLTEEYLKYLAKRELAQSALADLGEWRAYCEGEVYGYVVERRVTWKRDGDPDQTMTTWETVDSCWGFYGDVEYVKAEARAALEAAVRG